MRSPKKHNDAYFPRPMSQVPDLTGAPALLRALASDVEEPASGYAFASVTARQLRDIANHLDGTAPLNIPGISELDRLDAVAMLRHLLQRMDDAGGDEQSLAFVSAGTDEQSTTIKVKPRVAALVMQLIEAVRAEARTPNVA